MDPSFKSPASNPQVALKQLERRFSAETYHNQIELIRQQTGNEQQQALVELTKEGEGLDLKLVSHQEQHCFVPVQIKDGKLEELSQTEINALSSKERAEIASNMRYMDKNWSDWAYIWVILKMKPEIRYQT